MADSFSKKENFKKKITEAKGKSDASRRPKKQQ